MGLLRAEIAKMKFVCRLMARETSRAPLLRNWIMSGTASLRPFVVGALSRLGPRLR